MRSRPVVPDRLRGELASSSVRCRSRYQAAGGGDKSVRRGVGHADICLRRRRSRALSPPDTASANLSRLPRYGSSLLARELFREAPGDFIYSIGGVLFFFLPRWLQIAPLNTRVGTIDQNYFYPTENYGRKSSLKTWFLFRAKPSD